MAQAPKPSMVSSKVPSGVSYYEWWMMSDAERESYLVSQETLKAISYVEQNEPRRSCRTDTRYSSVPELTNLQMAEKLKDDGWFVDMESMTIAGPLEMPPGMIMVDDALRLKRESQITENYKHLEKERRTAWIWVGIEAVGTVSMLSAWIWHMIVCHWAH